MRPESKARKGGIVPAAEMKAEQRHDPHYRRVRDRRREPQQYRLRYRTAKRDDEGRHHCLAVPRLQAVQGAEHSHVRLCQMQASELVACEQALVLGSSGQGRRRGR